MARASKRTAARAASGPGYEGHFDELGDYTVAFEQFSHGGDMAPFFRGLPDDRCQTPHWRVVLKGRLTLTYAGGADVIEASEAYYAPPGHTPRPNPAPRRSSSAPPRSSARRLRS